MVQRGPPEEKSVGKVVFFFNRDTLHAPRRVLLTSSRKLRGGSCRRQQAGLKSQLDAPLSNPVFSGFSLRSQCANERMFWVIFSVAKILLNLTSFIYDEEFFNFP